MLGLMQGPASKLWRAGFFYLFLLDTHSTVPCSPPLTLKAQKENIAILQTNSTLKIKFFFCLGAKPDFDVVWAVERQSALAGSFHLSSILSLRNYAKWLHPPPHVLIKPLSSSPLSISISPTRLSSSLPFIHSVTSLSLKYA